MTNNDISLVQKYNLKPGVDRILVRQITESVSFQVPEGVSLGRIVRVGRLADKDYKSGDLILFRGDDEKPPIPFDIDGEKLIVIHYYRDVVAVLEEVAPEQPVADIFGNKDISELI